MHPTNAAQYEIIININNLLEGTLNESIIVIIVNSMQYKALQVRRNEMHELCLSTIIYIYFRLSVIK